MARAAWTDERLDDLAESMRSGFARLDQDLRDLRSQMVGELGSVRTEMREGFRSQRTALYSIGGGIIVALIGVIATLIAQGV
ncbi:MAG: hypothetical protein ACM31K_09290 [Solirubrobacterales bacterium]